MGLGTVYTKRRDVSFVDPISWVQRTYFPGTKTSVEKVWSGKDACYVKGSQATASVSTGFPVKKRLLNANLRPALHESIANWKTGSGFSTTGNDYSDNHQYRSLYIGKDPVGTTLYSTDAPSFAMSHQVTPGHALWPVLDAFDVSSMYAAGTTAIARVSPTNPASNMLTFLGEAREGLPRVPGRSLKDRPDIHSLGDEYLNGVFGWLPFISDLQSMAKATIDLHKIKTEFEAGIGKRIYRRYSFPVVETTTDMGTTTRGFLPVGDSRSYAGQPTTGPCTRIRHQVSQMWFSGCFSYTFDFGSEATRKFQRDLAISRRIYGLSLTPDVLWELIPWSWAADWFVNTGDIMKNLSNFSSSGLVMRWGYVMREDRITDTYTLNGTAVTGGPLTQSFTTYSKRRVEATPFGFGLNSANFTPQQLAIAAALGLSRTR